MKSILLFGGSGFIGRHLSQFLRAQGHQVRCSEMRADGFNRQDCLNEMRQLDVVINSAGLAHSKPGAQAAAHYELVNAEFPRQLASCAIESGVKHFIHISSVKAAAHELGVVNSELNAGMPTDIYGHSKRQGEQYLKALDWKSCQWQILRPTLVYGVGVKANLQSLLKLLSSRVTPQLVASGERSMVNVSDLCSAVSCCFTAEGASNGVYIITEANRYSVERIQRAVNHALNRKRAGVSVSIRSLLRVAQFIDQGFAGLKGRIPGWPVLAPSLEKLAASELYSGAKFSSDFGWQARGAMESVMPQMLASLVAGQRPAVQGREQ